MSIHYTAVIDESAKLGHTVSVGPYAVIGPDVTLGDGCDIGPHVVIHRYTTLGNNCSVHAGAVLGDLPQDLAFKDVRSSVRVGNDCTIREGVTIHRGTEEGSETAVGDECFLMAFSHLGHNVILGNNVILANAVLLAGRVTVGDGVFISGGVGVHQYVRIGRLAMIGGNSGVSKDVPPFCTLRPCALNAVGGMNIVGLKRAGMSPEDRKQIKEAFKLLYRSGLNVKQAVEAIREQCSSTFAEEFAAFAEQAKRGVCPFGGGSDEE